MPAEMNDDLLMEEGYTPRGLYYRTYRRLVDNELMFDNTATVTIHGLDSNSNTFLKPADDFTVSGKRDLGKGLAPELARKGRYVILIDLPGHSRSLNYPTDLAEDEKFEYTMGDMARSVDEVKKDLGVEGPLDFVGSCFAANVILKYAKDYPESFGVAVMSDPAIGYKEMPKKLLVKTLVRLGPILSRIPDDKLNFMKKARGEQTKTEAKTGSTEEELAWTQSGPKSGNLPNKVSFKIMYGLRGFEKELYGGGLPYLEGSDLAIKYVWNESYPKRNDLEKLFGKIDISNYGFESNHHAQMHPNCVDEVYEKLMELRMQKMPEMRENKTMAAHSFIE